MSIFKQLFEARQDFPKILKNRVADTGKYKYSYADLQSIREAVDGPLAAHGLAVYETIDDDHVVVEIRPVDADPEDYTYNRAVVAIPTDVPPQQMGSAITYARRYGLVTLLGLVTEDDEDGGIASGVPTTSKPTVGAAKRAKKVPEPEYASSERHSGVAARILALGDNPDHAATVDRCIELRDKYGWPMTVEHLDELEGVILLAENGIAAID